MGKAFVHAEAVRLADGDDERAPGGAITVALCGHWEHQGECRWPHFTTVAREGDVLEVRTEFDAPPEEEAMVRERTRAALAAGAQVGPDGRRNTWQLGGS